jgi:two-component system chemotaxis response regulator CheB
LVPASGKIRVMVVNDSHMIREYLCDIIRSHDKLELCGTARDGEDALKKLGQFDPDVIILDLEMPNLDGVTFIDRVMVGSNPIPIIVLISYGGDRNNNIIFDCLDSGAIDCVSIPSIQDDLQDRESISQDLVSRIETATRADKSAIVPLKKRSFFSTCSVTCQSRNKKVIVIGSSTGGPRVLADIFSKLSPEIPASILVVQHLPSAFTGGFVQHLNNISNLRVREAKEGDVLENGSAYVAPGDYHMTVTQSGTIKLDKSPKRQGVRPSANISMVSAANFFGANTLGVLLSGMGQDGAFGMRMIKRKGGRTIVQDSATSVVFGMPKAACDLGAVDEMVPADKMADATAHAVVEMDKNEMKEELQHV